MFSLISCCITTVTKVLKTKLISLCKKDPCFPLRPTYFQNIFSFSLAAVDPDGNLKERKGFSAKRLNWCENGRMYYPAAAARNPVPKRCPLFVQLLVMAFERRPTLCLRIVFLQTPTFIEWTEKRLETLLKEPASLFDGFIIWLETRGGWKEEKSELHVRSIILGKSLLLTCLMCQKKEYHTTYITTKRNWSRPKRKIFYSEIRLKVKIASISHSTFLWGETALKKVNGLFWTRNWKNI